MRAMNILALLIIHFCIVRSGGKKVPLAKDMEDDNISAETEEETVSEREPIHSPLLAGVPTETVIARKIPQSLWDRETKMKIVEVKDPAFFQTFMIPRSDAFLDFRWDKLDAADLIMTNFTDISNSTDSFNITGSEDVKEKRDSGPSNTTPIAARSSRANLGIYLTTGIMVAVCIIGLGVIFGIARANGRRARDYGMGNRQRTRNAGSTPAAAGWRRSQDNLDQAGDGAGEGIELQQQPDGNPNQLAMKRMESDVTDV